MPTIGLEIQLMIDLLLQDFVPASWAQVLTMMLPENGATVQANTIAGATQRIFKGLQQFASAANAFKSLDVSVKPEGSSASGAKSEALTGRNVKPRFG